MSVVDAAEAPFPQSLRQLGVRALCTNRDLPLLMPVGQAGGDLSASVTAPIRGISVIKGPSRPQAARLDGSVAWKLINQLTLNHLSLTDTDPEHGAAALRQILALYAPAGDSAALRQVDGVRSARLSGVVRRLPMPGPIAFGRGVEVALEVDDHAFEGASAYLLASVLDRFVARHVSLNSFTQLRMSSPARGVLFQGAPRCGARPLL